MFHLGLEKKILVPDRAAVVDSALGSLRC